MEDDLEIFKKEIEFAKKYCEKVMKKSDININEIPKTILFIGRPKRDTIINNDDILNLRIAFETSKDITELCNMI